MKKYLTVQQLAEYLPEKPHIETIRRLTREGKIPRMPGKKGKGCRVIYSIEEIDKWLKNGRIIQI